MWWPTCLDDYDVPECDCRVPLKCLDPEGCPGEAACRRRKEKACPKAPCEHVEDADHDTPLELWAARLLAERPGDYSEPPPPEAMPTLGKKSRILLMELRHTAGQALFHPDERPGGPADDAADRYGVQAVRGPGLGRCDSGAFEAGSAAADAAYDLARHGRRDPGRFDELAARAAANLGKGAKTS